MRITTMQLRRIIREAIGAQNALPLSAKAKEWLEWGEGYGLNPEADNEGQLLFYFDLNDDVDGTMEREAEAMGGDIQNAGMAPDGNVVVYTGEYTEEIDLGHGIQ